MNRQEEEFALLKDAAAGLLIRAEWNPKPQSDSQWPVIHAVEFVL